MRHLEAKPRFGYFRCGEPSPRPGTEMLSEYERSVKALGEEGRGDCCRIYMCMNYVGTEAIAHKGTISAASASQEIEDACSWNGATSVPKTVCGDSLSKG
jgi:hypothetical protein